jgi:phosphoribosylformylglycinamidine synthase
VCRAEKLKVETADSPFTSGYAKGSEITIPIAHHDGNYSADADLVAKLRGEDRVAFSYLDNPNGSAGDIAGVLSENRRVLGMMPHPERAVDEAQGNTDGAAVFASLVGVMAAA